MGLMKVEDWPWELFKVSYFDVNDPVEGLTRPVQVLYLVSTDTHLDGEAQEACGKHWVMYQWEVVAPATRPRQIGTVYGMRLDESARAAGEHQAKQMGVLA